MNVIGLAAVAIIAVSLCCLLLAISLVYRRQARANHAHAEKLRAQVRVYKKRVVDLRKELDAANAWNRDLIAAQQVVDQVPAEDPLEQIWRLPASTPDHEGDQ